MTSGEIGFVVLVVAGFVCFAIVLAYYAWQQSQADRRHAAEAPRQAEPAPVEQAAAEA
jgi:hypothetical protein